LKRQPPPGFEDGVQTNLQNLYRSEGSETLDATIFSGGDREVTGVLYVADLRIFRTRADGSRTPVADFSVKTAAGATTGSGIVPENWKAMDGDTSFAVAERLHGTNALGLRDGSINQFTTWKVYSSRNLVPVTPGESYEAEWQALYSIGTSGPGQVKYSISEPGKYRLRIAAANMEGIPTGQEATLEIVVPPPFTQRPLFWLVCGGGVAAAVFGAWRYVEMNKAA